MVNVNKFLMSTDKCLPIDSEGSDLEIVIPSDSEDEEKEDHKSKKTKREVLQHVTLKQ